MAKQNMDFLNALCKFWFLSSSLVTITVAQHVSGRCNRMGYQKYTLILNCNSRLKMVALCPTHAMAKPLVGKVKCIRVWGVVETCRLRPILIVYSPGLFRSNGNLFLFTFNATPFVVEYDVFCSLTPNCLLQLAR